MKKQGRSIEELLSEIASAEERDMQGQGSVPGRFTAWLDALFTAITFAEAGEAGIARGIMAGERGDSASGTSGNAPCFCTGVL